MSEDTNKEILKKLEELESKIASLENKSEQFTSDVRYMRSSFEDIKKLSGAGSETPIAPANETAAAPLNLPAEAPATVFSAELPPAQAPAAGRRRGLKKPAANMRPVGQANNRPAAMPPNMWAAPQAMQQGQPAEKKSLEQFIGKNAMGIGASVLVFIAMVMFATLLMPYIGQEVKCAAMYIFSFLLIGLGEWIYKKGKNGYLILSACGLGALYISIFATKIYFHFIDSIPLYALLLIWMGFASYLGKKRHLLYVIVGQIGIFIALCIASIGIITPGDLYLSFGFMVIAEALFFGLFWKSEYKYQIANTIGLFATAAAFDTGAHTKIFSVRYANSPASMAVILLTMLALGLAACRLIKISDSKSRLSASAITSLVGASVILGLSWTLQYAVTGLGLLSTASNAPIFRSAYWCYILVTFFLIAVLVTMIKKQPLENGKRSVLQYVCFGMIICSLLLLPDAAIPYLLAAVVLALTAYNYKVNQKDLYFVTQAVVFVAAWVVFLERNIPAGVIIFALSIAQMVYSRKKNPDIRMMLYEYISYVSTIAYVYILVDLISHQIWTGSDFMRQFATVGLFIVVQLGARETDWTDSDNGKLGIFHIANLAMMFYAVYGFLNLPDRLETVVYSLIACGLFSINLQGLLDIRQELGAYIGAKYTVLSGMIIHAFYAPSYVYSIVFLAMSIACIVVGFKIQNKSIRLYGLVLSMLSIVKLILFDVSYSNTLARAVSFLVCGLLCFGISLVYNRIDKQQKLKNQGSNPNGIA